MYVLRHQGALADFLGGAVYRGRRSGVTPGSHISDLMALGKILCLCANGCAAKLERAGGDYARATRPPLNQAVEGTCDACREQSSHCHVYKPREH